MRIGIGYDIHKLVGGRRLILGGTEIPYEKGLLGHSDADVLTHAVCDALLGATGLGDIGEHFPDTDKRFKDIESLKLLKEVNAMLKKKKYKIGNIDTVIVADKPKIAAYKNKMIKQIADTLNIKANQINIKATTEEGTRNTEAIAAYAVVLLTEGEEWI